MGIRDRQREKGSREEGWEINAQTALTTKEKIDKSGNINISSVVSATD